MTDIYMEMSNGTTDIRRLYKAKSSPLTLTLRGRGTNLAITAEREQLRELAEVIDDFLKRDEEEE